MPAAPGVISILLASICPAVCLDAAAVPRPSQAPCPYPHRPPTLSACQHPHNSTSTFDTHLNLHYFLLLLFTLILILISQLRSAFLAGWLYLVWDLFSRSDLQ